MSRAWCGYVLFILLVGWAKAAPWPVVTSDLAPDPALRTGVLENGLRYTIFPNSQPAGRTTLRLLVAVGSLQEHDDELGLAHFLEHMAFRGTRKHPGGTLTATLQRLGLGLGADNNAFTSFDSTIYHLELPDGKETTLREGLSVFREYAEGLTFDPSLLEVERGVIQSERNSRNTSDLRLALATSTFLWPKARENRRWAIGTAESIQHLTRDQFVGFYDAWYRPERMAVIIVGDVSLEQGERLIRESFDSLKARAPARDEPDDLITEEVSDGNISIYRDPELSGVTFTLAHPTRDPRAADTHARRARQLERAAAFGMFQARLDRKARGSQGTYIAGAGLISMVPAWQLATVSARASFENWTVLAGELEREHRRAIQFGFSEDELRQVRAQIKAGFDHSIAGAPTRSSPEIAAQIARALLTGEVFCTPATRAQDLADSVANLTNENCLAAFREAWSLKALHVLLAIHPSLKINLNDVARTLNNSRLVDVGAPENRTAASFAYTDFGAPGTIQSEQRLADLDVHLAKFENGVRLNAKTMTNEADTIDIAVRIGTGKLVPAKQPGLDYFAGVAFVRGGLHRHSIDELQQLCSGRNVSWGFGVGHDACLFTIRTSRRDFLLGLQIISAYLSDAGYRPDEFNNIQIAFRSLLYSLAQSPSGIIAASAERIMTGQDPRFGLPEENDFYSRTFEDLSAWLEPQLKHGAIEMTVVGDVPWDEIVENTARTLGALPIRDEPTTQRASEVSFPKIRDPKNFVTLGAQPQSAFAFYWPAPAISETREERRALLVAAVLAEEIRTKLREELGVTYTPNASFVRHEDIPGFSYFTISADVASQHLTPAGKIVWDQVAALAAKGVSKDTFERARQPFLRRREDELQTHAYWLYTVLSNVQQHMEKIDRVRDRTADTASITRDEVSKYLKRYFTRDNAIVLAASNGRIGPPPAAVPSNLPFSAETLSKPPRPLRQNKPIYPAELRAKNATGTVKVSFVVGSDGRVVSANAISSPDPRFSVAAEQAVLQWLFTPAEKDGRKVNVALQVDIFFDVTQQK